eukprot:2098538-Rhodomonas_salina.2
MRCHSTTSLRSQATRYTPSVKQSRLCYSEISWIDSPSVQSCHDGDGKFREKCSRRDITDLGSLSESSLISACSQRSVRAIVDLGIRVTVLRVRGITDLGMRAPSRCSRYQSPRSTSSASCSSPTQVRG